MADDYQIVTIGSATRDIFMVPEGLEVIPGKEVTCQKLMTFEAGAKIGVKELEYVAGGTAVNVAVGLSRQGIKSACLAALGDDESGREVKSFLEKEGVGTDFICQTKAKTDQSVIMLDEKTGERTIFAYKNAGKDLTLENEALKGHDLYVSSLKYDWPEKLAQISQLVEQSKKRLFLTPGTIQVKAGIKKLEAFLKNLEVIFMNEDEALEFTGKHSQTSIAELAKEIAAMGPKVVVITQGAKGVHILAKGELIQVPSKKVEAKDVTGAGDAFVAGFLAGYLKDSADLKGAAELGIENAITTILKIGAT